ncbi:MAG TPA: hypothetical protein VIU64_04670 [Polyangia bacterium]
MRALSLMLVVWLAPLVAGAVGPGRSGAAPAGPVADGAPAGQAAKAVAKDKGRGKGKGESDGPGAVPRTGPRPGKPPRPVMARRPATSPRARAPVAHLLRSGFRVTSTGSEVVLQTSAEVGLETRGTAAAPSFVLRRCRALRANDRRALDTRYFATAVTGVALRQRGQDLVVHVTLREPATATPRKEQGPGETWSWIVAFATPPKDERRSNPPPSSAPTATASIIVP